MCRWLATDTPLSPCTYFYDGKGCPVCKGCLREKHARQKNKVIDVEEEQTATLEGQKLAHDAAKAGLTDVEYTIRQKTTQVAVLTEDILQDVTLLRSCRTRLDEIALRKLKHSNVDLFCQIIQEEKKVQRPGFIYRIAGLEKARGGAAAIEKMVKAENPNDLFPQHATELKRCMSAGTGQVLIAELTKLCPVM